MQVLDIIIPDRYRGSKRIYEHDIAILRVRFVLTSLVLPICVDFSEQFSLKAGDVGIVSAPACTLSSAPVIPRVGPPAERGGCAGRPTLRMTGADRQLVRTAQVNSWGLTETQMTSPKLQYAKMPYIPFGECIKSVPDQLARYLTGDKFCAGNINGTE